MQLSIIILNYNVRYFLELCVVSVQNAIQNIDAEIIVVDNNSSDDSCAMMKQLFPDVRLIQNNENLGFPKGNNIGVKEAKGEYICILNPDTVIAEDTFEKIIAFAKTKSDSGIVGCKLIDGSGNFLPESKRGVPTPFVAFTKIMGLHKLFPKSRVFGKYYAQHLTENETGEVDILVGAFMIMKRDLYLEVGGFDENCFMYSDDIDLSYMILQKGKRNYYFHETTVIHYKGESTIRDAIYMKRFQQAMHFFYQKHFRVSIVFDVFLKMGAFFFTLLKKNKAKSTSQKTAKYFLLTEDGKVQKAVENLLGNKVKLVDSTRKNTINSLTFDNVRVEIIYDTNFWSFKSIIQSMQELKNVKFTFKILLQKSQFMIGSNTSNDKGEVIKF